jgi:hypothetical protein
MTQLFVINELLDFLINEYIEFEYRFQQLIQNFLVNYCT